MEEYEPDLEKLEAQFSMLGETFGGLEGVTSAFQKELLGVQTELRETGRNASGMSRTLSSSVKRAIEGMIFDGEKLTDSLSKMGTSIANSLMNKAVAPVRDTLGSGLAKGLQTAIGNLLPFANGGALSNGRVAAFARGGVVDGPTNFPMRGGVGLMGEAGPEAIMPLARGADGKLGVRSSSAAGAVNVTVNVSSPDAASFKQSQGQIAAEMTRALQRGRRNL